MSEPNGRARPLEALVTDVHVRSAVAGLRGLGRAGVGVVALAPSWWGAGLWSRYTRARLVGPNGLDDQRELAAALARLVSGQPGPLVLYPGREEAVDAIVNHAGDFPDHAVVPYSGVDGVHSLRDKRRLGELARGVGLTAPQTLIEATAGELLGLASIPAPCVIKQAHPERRSTLAGTLVFDSEDQVRAALAELPDDEPLLVQERANGQITSLGLVVGRDGRLVAAFQSRYRETWRIEAGSASSSVSVEPDRDLIVRAARMLDDAGYWGLAELEFIDVRGVPTIIDVNPRFYGSMPLAMACGVNLPAAWHAVALEREFPPPLPYRVGVSYRWLEADVSAFLNGYRERLLRRAPRPSAGAMWAADDPLPGALLGVDAALIRAKARMPGAQRMLNTRLNP